MPNQIDATALAGSVGPQDLSIWSLFLQRRLGSSRW
jgi:hypothetical protein